MSAENVDRVHRYMAAYNRRDFDVALEDFHPQVDWVLPARQSSDSCRGTARVRRFWEQLDETFDDLQLEPQESVDFGDVIATRLRYFGRGKGSGIELDAEMYHQLVTFRDGQMVRLEYFVSWPETLEAARAATRERPPGPPAADPARSAPGPR